MLSSCPNRVWGSQGFSSAIGANGVNTLQYRIYIPALEAGGVKMTLDVEAPNWMLALRQGLEEIGADKDIIKQASCDIKSDHTIYVTEPEQGRVFVLRERAPNDDDDDDAFGFDIPEITTPLPEPERPSSPRRTISHLDLAGIRREHPRLFEAESPPASSLERTTSVPPGDDSLLTSVFEELGDLSVASPSIEGTLQFALELVMDKIPSMAGWILLADNSRRDLYVAMASGPKAEQVIQYRLPFGLGIAGFCAVNGVSLSLSDVERDPRYQASLSRTVGLDVTSIACAPIQHDGNVYGVLQLTNHTVRGEYRPRELDALSYAAARVGEYLVSYAVVDAVS